MGPNFAGALLHGDLWAVTWSAAQVCAVPPAARATTNVDVRSTSSWPQHSQTCSPCTVSASMWGYLPRVHCVRLFLSCSVSVSVDTAMGK